MQPNVLLKSSSSLFVATEISPLLGIQNAGIRDQLPLQRKSVQSRCLFGLEQWWVESHMPSFHAYSNLHILCLAFSACSETTSVPKSVSLCTNGTLRSKDGKDLRSFPVASTLFFVGLCLSFLIIQAFSCR